MELVRKFHKTGSVQNNNHNRAWITNEDMPIGVLGLLEAHRTQFNSVRTLLEGSAIDKVRHELNEDDYDNRTQFS